MKNFHMYCYLPQDVDTVMTYGVYDSNLRLIEKNLKVEIEPKESGVLIRGNEGSAKTASNVIKKAAELTKGRMGLSHQDIQILIDKIKENKDSADFKTDELRVSKKGKRIQARTLNQSAYLRKLSIFDLVFAIGPAGTGKTYLAIAVALSHFYQKKVKKIILTRPVVEAGENLGFLPGTLEEKIDPYLRPLFDAIIDMVGIEEMKMMLEYEMLELAPLAYMRGRTLSNAFIVLDEAQNTTSHQMKMFLTRLGENSKMVVTGDISQIDIPEARHSGLLEAVNLFGNIEDIGIHYFGREDVVRHGLVKKIIEIYEEKGND